MWWVIEELLRSLCDCIWTVGSREDKSSRHLATMLISVLK